MVPKDDEGGHDGKKTREGFEVLDLLVREAPRPIIIHRKLGAIKEGLRIL